MALVTCHTLDHVAYCDLVAAETKKFLDATSAVDPTTRVPTCPAWTVADLLGHLGGVHRWAGGMIEAFAPERVPGSKVDLHRDDFDTPASWYTAGAADLLTALRSSDPAAAMWGWGADKRLIFWPRRMLHETGIHRADAEIAGGFEPAFDTDVAVDGVDEFLENLPFARWANVSDLRGAGALSFRASDADVTWRIARNADGFTWDHENAEADIVVEGSASDLYLLAWGRRAAEDARFTTSGDRELLEFWIKTSAI